MILPSFELYLHVFVTLFSVSFVLYPSFGVGAPGSCSLLALPTHGHAPRPRPAWRQSAAPCRALVLSFPVRLGEKGRVFLTATSSLGVPSHTGMVLPSGEPSSWFPSTDTELKGECGQWQPDWVCHRACHWDFGTQGHSVIQLWDLL